ncbi:MAG TPA: thiamine diphosphokinase [Bacteroidales bacterium]|nr:thiamine diphosphokinase [Bacteroidales bacterium]
MKYNTVILADGTFPSHEIPLNYLRNAERIVCCDGSTKDLLDFGLEPDSIVGDMDSLSADLAKRFSDRLHPDSGQDTNDLTKAVNWCRGNGYFELVIVGATGKREDHTIGNISLLAEYSADVNVIMVTDTGILRSFFSSTEISVIPGQQVSIFSLNPETEITSHGLKYPLIKSKLNNWWNATLNEATGNSFRIEFTKGRIIVYLKFL